MEEKRSTPRQQYDSDDSARVVLLAGQDISAQMIRINIVDISRDGIGLYTNTALLPGQQIEFVEEDYADTVRKKGIVMWSMTIGTRYRAGVKFI